jgi:hypothetical protein
LAYVKKTNFGANNKIFYGTCFVFFTPITCDGAVLAAQLGTPIGSYDEHSSKSSLSMKPRFIEPVGERTYFRRLMLADLAIASDNLYMAPYLGRTFAPAATWNLHTTQLKYFAPTYSEGFAINKGLNVSCGKR